MALANEYTFLQAMQKAEGVRQVARAAAFTAQAVNGSIPPANQAAYVTAMEAADNAYITAVNAAASTAGAVGTVIGGQTGPAGQAFIPCCWLGVGIYGMGPTPGASPSATFGNVPTP
jgi:hypothetical protein